MKILVTGGAGYLGSVLLPKLLVRHHDVRVVDVGYFGFGHLRRLQPRVEVVRADIRRACRDRSFVEGLLEGCEAVIHLAAISNDPSSELNPELTVEVNLDATKALADEARNRGIRFVFSSSCSVYGHAEDSLAEDDKTDPITTYARCKLEAEQYLESIASARWRPVILRNGTLHGFSPRMRFDLVVNIFSLYSLLFNRIRVFGKGLEWRPFLHVSDCARAFVHFAEREVEHLRYNISAENLRVVDLADLFLRLNPSLAVEFVDLEGPDKRDYRADTTRMRAAGFEPTQTVANGAEQIMDAIVSGEIEDPESIFYQNAKWLKELIQVTGRDPHEALGILSTLSMRGRLR